MTAMTAPIRQRLRGQRLALGISQADLARAMGLSQAGASHFEARCEEPLISTVHRYLDALIACAINKRREEKHELAHRLEELRRELDQELDPQLKRTAP